MSTAEDRRAALNAAMDDGISEEDRAALDELFGERAEPFYLNTPGDYLVGTVEEVGEFASEFGSVPQLLVTLERGKSAQTPEVINGSRYIVRLFGKTLSGRRVPKPGDKIAIGNRGKVTNKRGTFEYTDLELKYLS
jgi:hypothetical protein